MIHFRKGIFGFPEEKEFVIMYNQNDANPFHELISVNSGLTFVIVDPFEIFHGYEVELSRDILEELDAGEEANILVFAIVTLSDNIRELSVNLMGPLIINIGNNLGLQIILDRKIYGTKHHVYELYEE